MDDEPFPRVHGPCSPALAASRCFCVQCSVPVRAPPPRPVAQQGTRWQQTTRWAAGAHLWKEAGAEAGPEEEGGRRHPHHTIGEPERGSRAAGHVSRAVCLVSPLSGGARHFTGSWGRGLGLRQPSHHPHHPHQRQNQRRTAAPAPTPAPAPAQHPAAHCHPQLTCQPPCRRAAARALRATAPPPPASRCLRRLSRHPSARHARCGGQPGYHMQVPPPSPLVPGYHMRAAGGGGTPPRRVFGMEDSRRGWWR